MKTIYIASIILSMFCLACSTGRGVSVLPTIEPPTEKAKEYNYNYNQAKKIVEYTTKHKKMRQKISEQNREIQNENWYKLNATNKQPDTRNHQGTFKFYKNN